MSMESVFQHLEGLPVVPLSGYPAMQPDAAMVARSLQDPAIQAEALALFAKRLGLDAIFPLMDLSVEAEALGLGISWNKEGPPDVVEHPVQTSDDLDAIKIPDPQVHGRMPVFLGTIKRLKQLLRIPVGAYASSPFTLAGLLLGAEELAVQTLLDPDFVLQAVAKATEVVVRYAKAMEDAGADMIMLLDPTAVLLSPMAYRQFVQPSVEAISLALRVPTILHVCGQTTPLMTALAATNVDALSLDSDVDLAAVMDSIPSSMGVMGNINPVGTLLNAPAQVVVEETSALIRSMAKYRNFILSSGCDTPFQVPLENLEAFMSTARSFQALRKAKQV